MSTFHLGNLDLSNTSNFQFIYGSQLYGTLFGVYAKFSHKKAPSNNVYYISKIEFKTINYKGAIDLNIFSVDPPKFENMTGTNENIAVFKLVVRALHTPPFNPESETEDNRGHVMHFINENNGGADGMELAKGDFIYVDRKLKRMHQNGAPLDRGVFDTEFYYREGILQGGTYETVTPKPEEEDADLSVNIVHAGGICPQSINKVH